MSALIIKKDDHGVKFYRDEEALKNEKWYEWRSGRIFKPFWLRAVEYLLVPIMYLFCWLLESVNRWKSKIKRS